MIFWSECSECIWKQQIGQSGVRTHCQHLGQDFGQSEVWPHCQTQGQTGGNCGESTTPEAQSKYSPCAPTETCLFRKVDLLT